MRTIVDYLTIGQMAEQNCVTKKTLRLYHDKELLVPTVVDESNKRRYYAPDQRYKLDLIQRLQAIGMNLADIQNVLHEDSDEALEQAINHQLDELEQKQLTLSAAKETAKNLLEGIDARRHREACPSLPPVQLSSYGESAIWVFSCDELGISPIKSLHHSCAKPWNSALKAVKEHIQERVDAQGIDVPTPLLFQKVGVIYPRESYHARNGVCPSVFVDIGLELANALGGHEVMRAGTYLSISGECLSLVEACGGRCVPTASADRLFAYAKRHNYKTESRCYVETLVDPLALRSASVESLFRVRLRVLN